MSTFLTRCPKCGTLTNGIYCDEHRGTMPARPTVLAGTRVRLQYRGLQKDGVVEKVGRVNAVVLIEVLRGTKKKLVRVPIAALEVAA